MSGEVVVMVGFFWWWWWTCGFSGWVLVVAGGRVLAVLVVWFLW
jgi:hypothetical protein